MSNVAHKDPSEDNIKSDGPSLPVALGWNSGKVFRLAENVAKQVEYNPGDDIKALVERLGGRVSYSSLDQELSNSGSIDIRDNKFDIFLALDTSNLRDRFTMAHELGHWVLHYLYRNQKLGENIKWLRADRYGGDQAEREANWFAAAFLMPAEDFEKKFKELKGDILQLSSLFKVSAHAAEIRARALELK